MSERDSFDDDHMTNDVRSFICHARPHDWFKSLKRPETGRALVGCVGVGLEFVICEYCKSMESVAKRGRSSMWEYFHLISPNKVGKYARY